MRHNTVKIAALPNLGGEVIVNCGQLKHWNDELDNDSDPEMTDDYTPDPLNIDEPITTNSDTPEPLTHNPVQQPAIDSIQREDEVQLPTPACTRHTRSRHWFL